MIFNKPIQFNQNFLPVPDFIADIFKQSSLEIIYRENNQEAWKSVLNNADYVPFAYLENSIHFQTELQTGNGISLSDISVIIMHDKNPCAAWPLLYKVVDRVAAVMSFGALVLPPLFVSDVASVSKKKIIKGCIDILIEIGKQAQVKKILSEEVFLNTKEISDWHYQLIRRGAITRVRYDMYVDLSLDMEKIKNRFRKSYKSLISTGLKTWQVGKLDTDDPAIWEAFRQLHIQVTGRKTRTKQSWDIHFEAVKNKKAFLIYLRNDSGKMVGGGLFIHSGQECFYGVGAYDRSLFDKPLGHVVQFVAIGEMKKLGLQWFKVGTRTFPTDEPTPTDKEISVTVFKEGFATNIFPKYLLELPCTN